MQSIRVAVGRRSLVLWFGIAVAVIGGLLGMHALNLHAAPEHATSMVADHGTTGHTTAAQHENQALPCGDCGDDAGGHAAAVACVLALLVTLLLLPRTTRTPLLAVVAWLRAATAPAAPLRAAEPPSLYELSVLRT